MLLGSVDASWASDGERHSCRHRRQLRHEQSDTIAVEAGGRLAACRQWWCPGSVCLYGPQDPGPSAPLKWIHHSLAAVLSAKDSSHSNSHSRMIFLGINFYGYDFLLSG
ncbi:hypothetical protein ACJX0J_013548, partial [Zea mays]